MHMILNMLQLTAFLMIAVVIHQQRFRPLLKMMVIATTFEVVLSHRRTSRSWRARARRAAAWVPLPAPAPSSGSSRDDDGGGGGDVLNGSKPCPVRNGSKPRCACPKPRAAPPTARRARGRAGAELVAFRAEVLAASRGREDAIGLEAQLKMSRAEVDRLRAQIARSERHVSPPAPSALRTKPTPPSKIPARLTPLGARAHAQRARGAAREALGGAGAGHKSPRPRAAPLRARCPRCACRPCPQPRALFAASTCSVHLRRPLAASTCSVHLQRRRVWCLWEADLRGVHAEGSEEPAGATVAFRARCLNGSNARCLNGSNARGF
jgi:hypothetical protein